MKKAIAIALSVCMIFAISACGNKQENGETDSAQNQTQSQKTFAGRVADEYHKLLEGGRCRLLLRSECFGANG